MSTIPIILVEDDEDLAGALSEYLEIHGYEPTVVTSCMAFYRALSVPHNYQVALIDVGLPDQSGHVLAEYARQNTNMAVIVVTANNSVDNRVETYRSGADLFLAKPLDNRELLEAVAAMANRYQERQTAQSGEGGEGGAGALKAMEGTWMLDKAHRRLEIPSGNVVSLTRQEFQVMELFSDAGGETVERERILDTLYGREDTSAQRSLDNLMRRLRGKISQESGEPAPILTSYGIGYSYTEPLVAE